MVDALALEIKLQKHYLKGETLDTIYFGGGTPSILEVADIHLLLDAVYKNFSITPNPEVTLEANPDDLTPVKLQGLRELGINRLSIGIQSFNDQTLKFLNRAHNATQAIDCVKNARAAGIENLSIDLIFAIPGVSHQTLTENIQKAIEISPEHISTYSLTIEQKTVFGNWQKKGKLKLVNDEESAKQFDLLISTLEKNRYEQYEISNFCRDQKYAIHNTSYWKNVKYLGIGPGAHSYDSVNRQFNISNNPKYMQSLAEGNVPFELEVLDEKAKANEYILTSLRTKWGCDLIRLKHYFGYDLQKVRGRELSNYTKNNFLITTNEIMYLTRKGRFLADEIISDLFWV